MKSLDELKSMTVAELKILAREHNIAGYWKMKKVDLVKNISQLLIEPKRLLQVEEEKNEIQTVNNKKIQVKVIFEDCSEKIYQSCFKASKALNLKHRNAISSYWLKDKCLKAMKQYGIKEVLYVEHNGSCYYFLSHDGLKTALSQNLYCRDDYKR